MESRAQLVVPDAMLVARLSRGDLSAFEELYERYAREVFVLAAHALGRRDAEEVVQDVFLRLWERARQFDPERGSFAAWFMTIARHRVFDELKRRGNAAAVSAEVDELLAAAPDPAAGLDEQVVLTEPVTSCSLPSGSCPRNNDEQSSSPTSEA